MRTLIRLLTVALLLFATVSMATEGGSAKTYRFASYYIPLLAQDGETGAFVEVLREAANRADIQYEIVMAPTKRAMRYFEDEEVIALIPALLATLKKDSALTRPIFTKQIHAIVREGDSPPAGLWELEGMRVGLTRGFSYPRSIIANENIQTDYADTTDGSLKKLLEGRVDVVVADGYTVLSAIQGMELTGLDFDISAVLYEQPVHIACQPTSEGRELARILSVALDSMEADGTLSRILPNIVKVRQ